MDEALTIIVGEWYRKTKVTTIAKGLYRLSLETGGTKQASLKASAKTLRALAKQCDEMAKVKEE